MEGEPAPNDDLDLQLVWLKAMEDHGPMAVNERILGEYWIRHICGPWNEYGVGRSLRLVRRLRGPRRRRHRRRTLHRIP